jgi:hypothetical protein
MPIEIVPQCYPNIAEWPDHQKLFASMFVSALTILWIKHVLYPELLDPEISCQRERSEFYDFGYLWLMDRPELDQVYEPILN